MLARDIGRLFGVLVVIVEFGLLVTPSRESPVGGAYALAVEFRSMHD